jgi:chlorite dismutase
MAEVPGTLEGWYAIHDFRRMDWLRWKSIASNERASILEEAAAFVLETETAYEAHTGASGWYAIAGHKADLMQLHLRPDIHELNTLKRDFAQIRLSDYLVSTYSYVSITELSLYEAYARGGTEDREALMAQPFVQKRLFPPVPDAAEMPYVCFYPMNKRRGETVNWYSAEMEDRRKMMRDHASTGRRYHGKVQQMITGSTGLDDWEWGVTLFAGDALNIKKLIYEMRFDEVSAKYADFGAFYVGERVSADNLKELFAF